MKTSFLVAAIVLAGIPAAFAGDIVTERNHANCASPAMASCMSAPVASEVEFASDEYASSRRHAKRVVARQDNRARGSYRGTDPVYAPAPVAPVRGGDELYDSCNSSHSVFSCPGTGAN